MEFLYFMQLQHLIFCSGIGKMFNFHEEYCLSDNSHSVWQWTIILFYSDFQTVFVKDMSYYPVQAFKTNVMDILPKGYTSTFLIRNPKYTVPSHYKMCTNPDKSGKKTYHSFN